MKPMKISWVVLSFLILLSACKSNLYNYSIDHYSLTFEPRMNSTDVKAIIEITYLVKNGQPKADGFKFVGNSIVDSLICTDETGVISSNIEYLKETKLNWKFGPVHSGLKKVKAEFILRDFAFLEENMYSIDAPWAKVFRVPVKSANFQICFPVNPGTVKFDKPKMWGKHDYNANGFCFSNKPASSSKKIKIHYKF